MPSARPQEVRHEDRWNEELNQRSAEEADELSEHPEQGMPELVDREVEAVEPAVVAGVENQEPAVHREHGGEGEARAPLRYGTTRLERKVPLMITLPPPAGRNSHGPLSGSPRPLPRSEERRVGEEGRSRGSPYHLKKKKTSSDAETCA